MENHEMKQKLILDAKKIEPFVIKARRHIHMYPETLFEEENTAKFIEENLQEIGFNTQRTATTGVIATLSGPIDGMTTALRADIDALNVTEENDISYCSKNPGKMHACGHDAHSAMLLGAAKLLYENKAHLTGRIKLIFQPAEEGGAGAKKIIDEGHLDDVDTIFGLHIWHDLPSGVVATRKGPTLASSDRFTIIITGEGGHAASPHQTVDPISVSTDIYNALQKIISREIDPFEPRVLALPNLKGSDAHNIIPRSAKLQGTFRSLNSKVREYVIKRIHEIVEGYSKAWRCTGTVEFSSLGYPALINSGEVVDEVTNIIKELDDVETMNQSMISEDFAFYLQKTKGAFITLGTYNENKGIIFPHHHPKFQVDEDILWKGTAIYSMLGFYSLFVD